MFDYKAKVIRIVDGDTVELDIDLGFRMFHRVNCRLLGLNAPELNSTDPATRLKAQQAKEALTSAISGKDVSIISRTLDKYGRPLVTIFFTNTNINDWLISAGFAVPMSMAMQLLDDR